MRRINIKDVAQRAGVSISTVSRVLNDTGYPVRSDKRQRVLAAAKEMGFRPNDLARGLHLKKSRTIGLVIPDISNPYYPELAFGVGTAASEHGYAVIYCNTNRKAEKLEYCVDVLLQKRADGIILAGGGTEFAEVSQALEDFDTEVAVIGRHNLPFPSVQIDNVGAAREVTAHLADLGHQQIAFIGGQMALTSVQDRLSGYKSCLEEHGLAQDAQLVREGDFGERSGYSAGSSLLQGQPTPTAIFAANDRMAIGAMAAAADLGLKIPEDVSIVGFDDITVASYIKPTLTTVAVPSYNMGVSSVQLLLKLLSQEECQSVIKLPTELVIRDSTGLPQRAEDLAVKIEKGGTDDKVPK